MKCPLFRAAVISAVGRDDGDIADCLGSKCAWWDKNHERCTVLGSLHELSNLTNEVAELKEKLPQARQTY